MTDRGALQAWGRQAQDGTWATGRWRLEPVPFETYTDHPRWATVSNYVEDAVIAIGPLFRIMRVPGK